MSSTSSHQMMSLCLFSFQWMMITYQGQVVQEDIVMYESYVDETLKVSLQLDEMMRTYAVKLVKVTTSAGENEEKIFMTENVTKKFICALDKLKPLIRKYMKTGFKFCYKLELADSVYVTFGQNTPQYGGSVFIDVRHHFSDEDGHILPTKVGIRINPKYASSLSTVLAECLEKIPKREDINQVVDGNGAQELQTQPWYQQELDGHDQDTLIVKDKTLSRRKKGKTNT